MIKKIEILGMQIDNFTVREAMLRLDTYMSSTVLNIIETVSMRRLILAAENETVRECINSADLSVIGEKEILSETGNALVQRTREVVNKDFMYELLKRAADNGRRVCLIAETKAQTEKMQEFFTAAQGNFVSVGNYALEDCTADADFLVNELNTLTPDIIISSLPSPEEEMFLTAHKDNINANVWYGVGKDYDKKGGFHIAGAFKRLAQRGELRHAVAKYRKEGRNTL